jgi:predicted ATP-binding protein involved in virulence
MRKEFPCQVQAVGVLSDGSKAVEWSRALNTPKSGTTIKDARVMALHAKEMQQRSADSIEKISWPLLSYYGTGRLWNQKKLTSGKMYSSGYLERAAGYLDCLEPASSFKLFVNWFSYAYRSVTQAKIRFMETNPAATPQEVIGLQSVFSPLIDAVREAVNVVLRPTGWGNIWYSEADQGLTASHPDIGTLAVSQLSDGIRISLAVVADIAFRAVQLNPHLGADAGRLTHGIVLIDEVDMHLHPSWQQLILQLLREAFPRLQFIVTTHSPQVLTSVDAACIRKLVATGDAEAGRGRIEVRTISQQTRGLASADVLAAIMGVNPVPDVPEARKLSEYHALIQQDLYDSDEGVRLRAELDAHFSPNHPVMHECDRMIRLQAFKQKLPAMRGAASGDA